MKMIKSTLSLVAAIVIFASCNQFQKSPSGMPYKITKGNSKELLKHGQFVKLNIEYKVEGRYCPATRETPEEHPDIVISKITAVDSDIDLQDLLDHHVEGIYETLIDNL